VDNSVLLLSLFSHQINFFHKKGLYCSICLTYIYYQYYFLFLKKSLKIAGYSRLTIWNDYTWKYCWKWKLQFQWWCVAVEVWIKPTHKTEHESCWDHGSELCGSCFFTSLSLSKRLYKGHDSPGHRHIQQLACLYRMTGHVKHGCCRWYIGHGRHRPPLITAIGPTVPLTAAQKLNCILQRRDGQSQLIEIPLMSLEVLPLPHQATTEMSLWTSSALCDGHWSRFESYGCYSFCPCYSTNKSE